MVTALLIRNVGRKKAAELCMTGDRIPAAEAERIGIINYSVPKDSFQSKVAEMAKKLDRVLAIFTRGRYIIERKAVSEYASILEGK